MKKTKARKRIVLTIVILIIIAIAIVVVNNITVMEKSKATYQSYVVDEDKLEKNVSGKGALIGGDIQNISVLSGVQIDKVTVKRGTAISEGDVLATLDVVALKELQKKCVANIKELEQTIVSMDSTKSEKTTYAEVSGRIKSISQSKDNEALIVIALDGKMRVEVMSDTTFAMGSHVKVKLKDGNSADGIIDMVMSGSYVVEIFDDSLLVGENVEIFKDDKKIGEGTLQINAPITIRGDYSNIKKIHVKINDKVSVGDKLITWKKAQIKETYNDLVEEYNRLNGKLVLINELIVSPNIIAEQAGIISEVNVSNGDVVGQESIYTPIFTLINNSACQFEASLGEKDIALISIGQEAKIELNTFPNEKFNAVVTDINHLGNVTDGITTFVITLSLSDNKRFLVGMNGKVSFTIDSVNKGVILPLELVLEDGDGEYVYVTPSGDLTGQDKIRKNIVTGIANDYYVQIVSGLVTGDIVLYENIVLLPETEENGNGE